jgi:hypothetical protein
MIVVLLALLALIGKCSYNFRVLFQLLRVGSLRREKNARKKKKIDFFFFFFLVSLLDRALYCVVRNFRFNIDVDHYNIRNRIVALPPLELIWFFCNLCAPTHKKEKTKKKNRLNFFFFFFFFLSLVANRALLVSFNRHFLGRH